MQPEMVFGHNLQHMAPFGVLTIAFCMVFQGATLIFSAPGTRFGARTQPGNSPSRICQIWDLKNGIWSPFGHIGRTPRESSGKDTNFPARTQPGPSQPLGGPFFLRNQESERPPAKKWAPFFGRVFNFWKRALRATKKWNLVTIWTYRENSQGKFRERY